MWIECRIEKRNKKSAEIKDSKRISRSTGKVREREDVNECDMTHLTILTIVEWNISANSSQASSPGPVPDNPAAWAVKNAGTSPISVPTPYTL